MVDIKDFKKEQKKREFWEGIKSKGRDFEAWFYNNKDLAMIVLPVVGATAMTLGKGVIKSHHLKKEEKLKDNYCYDRSLGHYWKLKRSLTNDEWLEIDQRKKEGERLSDILASMKVLK